MASGKLTAKGVAAAKPGRHGDGAGLWLAVSPTGSKRWLYRFTISGRVSETALGGYPELSLAEARDAALEARRLAKQGVKPTRARRASLTVPTFGQVADQYVIDHTPRWKNAEHRKQWRETVTKQCSLLRDLPVDQIGTQEVLATVRPIWSKTQITGDRVRNRIETILDAARALGHIPEDRANPARWRGHLSHLLAKKKLAVQHHASMAFEDVPALMQTLSAKKGFGPIALRFAILTAARTSEVLQATFEEFDLDAAVWTRPGVRMKNGKPHRVPLSGPAVAIIKEMSAARVSGWVFPGRKPGTHLTKNVWSNLLKKMKIDDATGHGFRTSFKDWSRRNRIDDDLSEISISHTIGSATERAYARDDLLELRRDAMDAWSAYCMSAITPPKPAKRKSAPSS